MMCWMKAGYRFHSDQSGHMISSVIFSLVVMFSLMSPAVDLFNADQVSVNEVTALSLIT